LVGSENTVFFVFEYHSCKLGAEVSVGSIELVLARKGNLEQPLQHRSPGKVSKSWKVVAAVMPQQLLQPTEINLYFDSVYYSVSGEEPELTVYVDAIEVGVNNLVFRQEADMGDRLVENPANQPRSESARASKAKVDAFH
jgi:hypothetical protein